MVVKSVSSSLDEFYDELRQKYPHTFTLVTDLGQERGPLQRLPALELKDTIIPGRKSLMLIPQDFPHAKWATNNFFSKVQFQKIHSIQKCSADFVQQKASPLIINNSAIHVPYQNNRQATSGHSVQLPNLRSQIEQNQAELRTRLHSQNRTTNGPSGSVRGSDPLQQCSFSTQYLLESKTLNHHRSIRHHVESPRKIDEGEKKIFAGKPDPLGTIMRELLPNRPGKLLPKDRKEGQSRDESCHLNGDCESLIYISSPAKIFRPKPKSPQRCPTQTKIIKRFSAKPKTASGPLRADHTIGKNTLIQTVEVTESVTIHSDSTTSTTSSNDGIKPGRRVPTPRVRFEDESLKDAECRYQERAFYRKRKEGSESVVEYSVSKDHSQPEEMNINEVSGQRSLSWSKGMARQPADDSSNLQALPFTVANQGRDGENIAQPNENELVTLGGISLNFHSHSPISSSLTPTEWQNHGEKRALKNADNPSDGNLSCLETFHSSKRDIRRHLPRLQVPQSKTPKEKVQISLETVLTGQTWSGAALKQTQPLMLKVSSSAHSPASTPVVDCNHHWPLMGSPEVRKQHSVKEFSYLYSKVKKTLQSYIRRSSAEGSGSSTRKTGVTSELQNCVPLKQSSRLAKDISAEKYTPSIHHPVITSICNKRALFPESSSPHRCMDLSEEKDGNEQRRMPHSASTGPAHFPHKLVRRTFLKKGPAQNYLVHSPTPPI
uniref:Uncharacterized protein LOC117368384 n=1 Tax=Geotrypetes seraphini TaxID=260995 RepID=A0A6P8SHI0_GEOSA|nr:uncharacterized protein LOC117368384 [Geotrypetes seraphini]XP_033817873.1 uncharacterized protein LOC117368384 [Geotrypetes seraphini]